MPQAHSAPPSSWATAGEMLSGFEALRLAARTPQLARLPRGDGRPVIAVPGLGATDASLAPLRRFLRDRGHAAESAGFGRINGDVPLLVRRLVERTVTIHRDSGRKVALVGWSLGGVLSREAARLRPDLIARVITFGTPVVGGPANTAFARRYSDEQLRQIAILVAARDQHPIRVPITAIWSRRDGIVAPRACIDTASPFVENIEVKSTHFGLGIDPDVWSIVATRLAVGDSG